MLTANNWNVVQYSMLVIMLSKVCGLKPGEFVHVIADAHIYDRHIPLIEKMLEQPVYDAPEFVMDKSVKDFYAFNTTHFKLENYRYNDFEVKPEVAV